MWRTWNRLKFVDFVTCMENMPWVVQWYGVGCDCLMKDTKLCMMICGAAPIVCGEWRFERAFEEKIRDNSWFTITSLSLHFPQISWSLLHQIVSGKVKFRKLCANWVPKMLTEEHKLEQQATTLDFMTQYNEEGENFLSHVVKGNETWVSHEDPKSKQQSMEWRHTSSPRKTKFKQTTSTREVMWTMFWDRKVILLVDFLPQGSTINAGVCCNTLQKLHHMIQNKRRGMFNRVVVMIHDNTHPHTAMQNLITTFHWEQFDHPPYSPHLVPSDFHLLLHLKSFLPCQWFHEDSEVKEAVTTCFA